MTERSSARGNNTKKTLVLGRLTLFENFILACITLWCQTVW